MRNLSETICSKLKWFAPMVMLTLARAGIAAEPGSADTSAQGSDTSATATGGDTTPVCKDSGVSVTFKSGSSDLDRNARGALSGIATWMGNGDQRTVRLEGFTDKAGNEEANQRLSEKRAQAAKDFLVGHGADSDRVAIVGHGEEQDGHDTPSEQRVVAVKTCDVPKPAVAMAEPEAAPPAPAPEAVEPTPPVEAVPPAPEPAPAPVAEAPLPPPAPMPPPAAPRHLPPSRIGIEAAVGAGATGFVENGARNTTDIGSEWNARLTFGSRSYLAVEAAYIGSIQGINALGLSTDARLLGNGAEGTLRINFTRARIQPYVFGGAGWTHYQLNNTPTVTTDIRRTDDIGTVPLGGGISARVGRGFLIDVRGGYKYTFNEDLLNTAMAATGQNSRLDSWNVGGRLGWEF
jgi:outer membrane protein OmpA-like peptidoglycan-associated protein